MLLKFLVVKQIARFKGFGGYLIAVIKDYARFK